MNVQLRDYQLELVEAVWNEICAQDTALAVLPTGGGKTVCIAEIMRRAMAAKPDIRIAMVMGRIDLVTQTERALAKVIDRRDIGVYCGSMGRRELSRRVIVASIQSIADINIPHLNLLVIDEVHNLDQKGGAYLRFIEKAKAKNPRLKTVGFTATPFRATGEIFGESMLFKRVCYRKTIKDMIAIGCLCEPKMRSSKHEFDVSTLAIRAGEYRQEDVNKLVDDKALVTEQVKDALARMTDRQSVVWATANIDHCNMVADTLMEMGERCTTVHSKLNKENRGANLLAFISASFRHMSFVTVLSEGFDHPPIDCVVLMRPTRSPVLYVQTCGRGLRPFEGKKDCIVLDYGQVIRTLGPLDDPKIKGKKSTFDNEAVMKECPQCLLFVFGGFRQCPDCGYEFPPPPKPAEKLDRRADNALILSEAKPPETVTCGPAVIAMHKAKSGNDCVRISYQDRNIITRWGYGGVSEYFVTNSPWTMKRLERRLHVLGAQLPSIPFAGEIVCEGTFELVKVTEGRYDRVQSVKRVSDVSPKGEVEVDKGWLEKLEDDASFDFGANAKPTAQAPGWALVDKINF